MKQVSELEANRVELVATLDALSDPVGDDPVPAGVSPLAGTEQSHATAQQSKMLAKAMQEIPESQRKSNKYGRRLLAHGIDCFLVAFMGAFIHAMVMHFVFSAADPHLNSNYIFGRDLIMGWVLFFMASLIPVLLPGLDALMYFYTHRPGAPNIGDFLLNDSLSAIPGQSLGAQVVAHTPVGEMITQWLLIVPMLFLPLYKALCQASPMRASIGEAICKLKLTDEQGGRVGLKEALYRNFFWFLTPFIAYIKTRAPEAKSTATATACEFKFRVVGETVAAAPRAVMMRYRSFAGFERWVRDRFADNKVARYFSQTPIHRAAGALLGLTIVMSLPFVLGFAAIYGMQVLVWVMALMGFHVGEGVPAAVKALNDRQNMQFVMSLYTFLLGGFAAAAIAYLRKPTDLLIDKDGMRWFWRFSRRQGKLIRWQELSEVKLVHDEKKGSTQQDQIAFSSDGREKLTLKTSCLDSIHDKELLLAAIECWSPHLKRNAELVQSLQPPADLSYTEVWLAALTAPPKRERLKPLVEGVKLHDNAYKVVRSIGTGGQGFAYLAEHGGEQVVLKEFILPVFVDVSVRRKALEKFESEARLLKRLDNNQVVKLVDYFVEDHRAYLVLEYIDGISLRRLVEEKGALPQEQVLELTRQMADILEYLHNGEPPVVHRDFTPDNLILRKDGTLKLIDFNVAQQLDATVVATVVGKHAYLAPEQFQGMPVTQSDIYSMGATIHYLLTGKDPLPISVSNPKEQRPEVDDLLDLVVSRCTARSLVERYATIAELVKELWP